MKRLSLRSLRSLGTALVATACLAPPAGAQAWRHAASGLGTTARVLIIGTRPEDEDNALIAWLRLSRHVETAYLSLTRGESGVNVAGNERQSALGVVRTAELLAERDRDGAHQYFTRAYDFGFTKLDSVVDAGWPHDSLVHDVVSVVRAFRPHLIISLFNADSSERDATHRVAARLAREAFALAADTVRLPSRLTSLLPAWTISRLAMRLDSAAQQPGVVAIDVGEFDRASGGRSYAELGAEVRRLQRTQPPVPSPPIGRVWRYLRIDDARADSPDTTLFGVSDTSLARFRGVGGAETHASFDSLERALDALRARAATDIADSVALALARIAARAASLETMISCRAVNGVPACLGTQGDFALSLAAIEDRATRTLVEAENIIIDGTVDRERVAERDGVPLTVTILNGGSLPFTVRELSVTSRTSAVSLVHTSRSDSAPNPPIVVLSDSMLRWSATVGVNATDYHWWQFYGLVKDTWLHQFRPPLARPVIPQLISGEDRIPSSGVDATLTIGGADVRVITTPLVHRGPGIVRGDGRHPLTGVPPISVLGERVAEYERAGLPIDRLFRVELSSAHLTVDTAMVSVTPPVGLSVDSAVRLVVLPPLGSATVFFRLRGMMAPGEDSAGVEARLAAPAENAKMPNGVIPFQTGAYKIGVIPRDYPHIPSQLFVRAATDRIESVSLRVPSRLHVAYVKGADDMQPPLGQLQINVQAIEPSLLSAIDLSGFSTVLIGSGAFENSSLASVEPALRAFMRKGGTVVVMPGGVDVASSGLLPYPLTFDNFPARLADPSGHVHVIDAKSPILNWPNAITSADFEHWSTERARGVPIGFDSRYRTVLSMSDPGESATSATILSAPVGKGLLIYTSLALDTQLAAVNPGAARLMVNLLAAGLENSSGKK